MKSTYIRNIVGAILLGFTVTACNDMLDITPPSSIIPEEYLTEESQLDSYMIARYATLPNAGGGVGLDNNTDNEAGMNYSSNFTEGDKKVPETGGSWDFTEIYQINYFLDRVLPLYKEGKITGNKENIDHYIGEAYFFRGMQYFNKLVAIGDCPIIRNALSDNYEILLDNSKRMPRTEVARFIISDLDSAAMLMKSTSPDGKKNRMYKDIAYLFKSRVALYEGTWLKYFKGTAFVPNGQDWPGATREYNKGYQFQAGSIDEESKWFLQQAIEAADQVASRYELTANTGVIMQGPGDSNPYVEMFSDVDMSKYAEILLWRDFDYGLGVVNNRAVDAGTTCTAIGLTRGLVQSYLMKDGLPYYASSLYQGDETSQKIAADRDDRIRVFMKQPGMTNIWLNIGQGTHGVITEPNLPDITNGVYTLRNNTGYLSRKYWHWDHALCNNWQGETGVQIFRAAEAYLNYIEAYYECYGNLDSKAANYWRKLRSRANIEEDYTKTIAATNMQKEAELDWAAYSAGNVLSDATLFNIRRERRNEFLSEGLRWNDLKRWRAMDQMMTKKYHIEGFKLWNTELVQQYADAGYNLIYDKDPESNVSSPSLSDYLRPFEILKSNRAYAGYGWFMAHYLEPIAMQHFMITSEESDNYTDSPIYQNPYWPVKANYTAEK